MLVSQVALGYALALWVMIAPVFGQTPAKNIQDEIHAKLSNCSDVSVQNGFLKRGRLQNGNPSYWVVDYGHVVCDGSKLGFCGSAGCLAQIFVLRPAGYYEKVLDSNVRGLRIVRVDGRPAMSLELHGSACGLAGYDVCRKIIGLGERVQ
jgi:hypothetical protein